jgi:SAM-dependent methyltransferase
VKAPHLVDQLGLKKRTQAPALLPDALPYPAKVCRRTFRAERVRKHGGLDVFDTPEALALNEARRSQLESLGWNLAGKRVLDVGAGVGHLAAWLQKMGSSVVCLEGRAENVEAMRSRHPQIEGHVADAANDPLSRFGRFDVVFSYGLLYHLENPLHAIRNLESVCGELLLLESMVCGHDRPLVLVEDESSDVNPGARRFRLPPQSAIRCTCLEPRGIGSCLRARATACARRFSVRVAQRPRLGPGWSPAALRLRRLAQRITEPQTRTAARGLDASLHPS